MIFYLIRHGRQNSSDCNVNVPLADAGIKQAELLGKRLRNYSIDAVYCSDLIRAKQTAEIAFSHNEFLLDHLQVRSGLAEIDFGDLTGIPDAQVKSFYANYYKQQQHLFEQKRSNRQSKQPVTIDSPAKYVGDFFVPVEEMIYPGGEECYLIASFRYLMKFYIQMLNRSLWSVMAVLFVCCSAHCLAAVLLDGSNLVLHWKTAVSQQSIMMKHYMDSFWTVLTTARI